MESSLLTGRTRRDDSTRAPEYRATCTESIGSAASQIFRAVAENEAEKRRQEQEKLRQKEQAAMAQQQQKSAQPAAPETACCARYQLAPPFLLDTQSGRVWRYDQGKDVLVILDRESTKIEKSWEALLTAKLAVDFADGFADATRASTLTEHTRVAPLVKAHIDLLDKHVKALAP